MDQVGDDDVSVFRTRLRTNKRKSSPEIITTDDDDGGGVHQISTIFPLNELNQDLLERVLSWLPTSSFLRLTSVCKRWKSMPDSATFKLACSQVTSRDPWFLMVDPRKQPHATPIAFDSSEGNWMKLDHPPLFSAAGFIPVAASGGLLCFHNSAAGYFIITNPITGACHQIASLPTPQPQILAIAMTSKAEAFKLFVISGELPNITFRQYNSAADQWEEEITMTKKSPTTNRSSSSHVEYPEANDDVCTQYFLSKCGNVVSTDIQRSPSKQYSSVLTIKDGDEILHFLSSSGTVVACNLTRRFFSEYARLLPVLSEYSIDLVECGGEMRVVLLCDFLESCSLRAWSWDEKIECWRQVAAMPPYMSQKFYGKNADINCTGGGGRMFVCVNSGGTCSYVMCELVRNEWVEIPECCDDNGEAKEFACALCFEPRVEASV